jgi:hypothetical protein
VRLLRYLCGTLAEEASEIGRLEEKRELTVAGLEVCEASVAGSKGSRGTTCGSFMGITSFEKAANPESEGRGVTAFTKQSDFGGGVREGGVNNEPVESIWYFDPG